MTRRGLRRELAADLLSEGRMVRILVAGSSMRPFFRSGTPIVIEPLSRSPRVGDVVAYRSDRGLVVHRVWSRRGESILTKGDAFTALDEPVPRERVLGLVTRVGSMGPRSVDNFIARRLGWLVSLGYPRVFRLAQRFRRTRFEPEAEPPLLTEGEVVAGERTGALPSRFRVTLESDTLRPFLKRGAVVTVSRRKARKGVVVCLAENGRLVWRRVLAARGGSLLLRGEMAPFADGWFEGALGSVETAGLAQALARRAPHVWTSLGWRGHQLWTWSRAGLRRAHRRRGRVSSFRTGVLGPADAEAYSRLHRLAKSFPAGEKCVVLGLWTEGGELVGSTLLIPFDGDRGLWSDAFVDPAFRNQGGGRVLLRAMVEEGRKRGLRRLFGWVAAHNLASLRACRRAGLRPNGRWWSSPVDRFAGSEEQLLEVEAVLDQHPSRIEERPGASAKSSW